MTLEKEDSFLKSRSFLYARSVLINLVAYTFVYWVSYAIKFDEFSRCSDYFFGSLAWILAIKMGVLYVSAAYRSINYLATVRDLYRIIVESGAQFCAIVVFSVLAQHSDLDCFGKLPLPLSVLALDMILSIVVRGGGRLVRRYFTESRMRSIAASDTDDEPALLVGANERGAHIANIINTQRNSGVHIVGFLTIHKYKVNMRNGLLPVVADVDNFVSTAKNMRVSTILFVAGSMPGKVFRSLYEKCDSNGLVLRVVPQVEFLPDTKIPVREVDVNDLLKRDPIKLDDEQIRQLIAGRRVMVTGAGGSIGSEICRQIMRFEPEELFILGRGENRIFFLERELLALKKKTKITPIIADVSNPTRMDTIFAKALPEIVFHAAAHKHVPLMEANIPEAVRNNMYGTKVVADCADRYGAKKFVMVSTDKAVNPSSIMGCSKQMAERYVNALAAHSKTCFIVTRFGNVLGSNGSVVPIFTKQIQNGGPITITDKRMTRYFMTIPEASQLVLDAAAMGKGGEIFVLDMGEPVHIMDLAKDLIRLAGLPEHAIEIQEVGLRPGEKLYEELYFESEERIPTSQEKLFAAKHRQFKLEDVQAQIKELCDMTSGPQEAIRERLRDFIPEYKPTILPEKK